MYRKARCEDPELGVERSLEVELGLVLRRLVIDLLRFRRMSAPKTRLIQGRMEVGRWTRELETD